MVRDIPVEYALNDEALLAFFTNIYGPKAVLAKVVPKVVNLSKLAEKRRQAIENLMDANDKLKFSGKRPSHRTGVLPCIGQEIDSITHYKDEVARLTEEITIAQHSALENSTTGFVTFSDVLTATQCAQCLHLPNPLVMSVQPAPQVRDINWNWITATDAELTVRKVLVNIFLVLFFFLWSIPVTAGRNKKDFFFSLY